MATIPIKVQRRYTVKRYNKEENLIVHRKNLLKLYEVEIQNIKKSKHVIGRTTWDKACTSQINPDATVSFF